MAGRNYPIPGGTRSRRSQPRASGSPPRTCAVSARPARPPISAPTAFSTHVGDMVALVEALGEKQAVIIGHDWGAPVAWHAALFRPDIFTAVAGLSVPPPFRGRGRPLDTLRDSGITNFYWQYFQTPGVAEAEFERDVGLVDANPARTRIFRSGGIAVRRGRQGISRPSARRPRRCRIGSAKPTSPISARPTGNPASAAG